MSHSLQFKSSQVINPLNAFCILQRTNSTSSLQFRDAEAVAGVAVIMANALSPLDETQDAWYQIDLHTPPRATPFPLNQWSELVRVARESAQGGTPWTVEQYSAARAAAADSIRARFPDANAMYPADIMLYSSAAAQVASRMQSERPDTTPPGTKMIMRAVLQPVLPIEAILGCDMDAPLEMVPLPFSVVDDEKQRILSSGLLSFTMETDQNCRELSSEGAHTQYGIRRGTCHTSHALDTRTSCSYTTLTTLNTGHSHSYRSCWTQVRRHTSWDATTRNCYMTCSEHPQNS
jgi:hypothetical protein